MLLCTGSKNDEGYCDGCNCGDQGTPKLSNLGNCLLHNLQKMYDAVHWDQQADSSGQAKSTCRLHQEQEAGPAYRQTLQWKGAQS